MQLASLMNIYIHSYDNPDNPDNPDNSGYSPGKPWNISVNPKDSGAANAFISPNSNVKDSGITYNTNKRKFMKGITLITTLNNSPDNSQNTHP